MTGAVLAADVDWTQIITALIAALPAIIAAFYARNVKQQIRTPSGDTIGKVTERTHDLAAVNQGLMMDVHGTVMNGTRAEAQYRDEHPRDDAAR